MEVVAGRILVLIYAAFFLLLAIQVLDEARDTVMWTSNVQPDSVLVTLSALSSSWFTAIFGALNLALGIGGGMFARPAANEKIMGLVSRIGLLVITGFLIILSLWALWSVASSIANIAALGAGGFDVSRLDVREAVGALATLNVTIVTGFIIGLAIPGTGGASDEVTVPPPVSE